MFSLKVRTHLEVGGRLRVTSAAIGLVQEITEDVEEEKYWEQVQEGEEALIIVEGGVVRDHLGGQEREADDDQEERVEERAGDEQTSSENKNICEAIVKIFVCRCQSVRWPIFARPHSSPTTSILSWLELKRKHSLFVSDMFFQQMSKILIDNFTKIFPLLANDVSFLCKFGWILWSGMYLSWPHWKYVRFSPVD